MSILIAGGAGFIGTNLCKYLLANTQEKIICIDNLYTGNLKNIQQFIKNKKFKFIKKDIQEISIEDLKEYEEITQIYNLACPASPKAYQGKHAIETIKTCTQGVLNLAEIATEYNAKILQASTSEIYGEPLQHPQKENYRGNVSTIGIRACYDEGKRIAETILYEYKRNYGIQIAIARIFNTYGPYMNKQDGRVITNFIVQALKNEDITIYGDGTQTRSFCYIDDLIKGLIKLMGSDYNLPINLGNPFELTIKKVAEIIIKKCKSKSEIKNMALPKDDPTKRKPDISKAKEILKWEPQICLVEGIDKTIEYIKGIL